MPAKLETILPSRDDDAVKAQITRLIQAAATLGVALDPQGFTLAWLSDSTRVVLATEGDTPVGLAVVVFGRRWYDAEPTASVLLLVGPARQALLVFTADMAKMLGARRLFWEGDAADPYGQLTTQRVLEL